MENISIKYQSLHKTTRNRWCLLTAYGMCLQHERDISGGRSLSGNMVSSDCWGMSTLLILCKPVWGMICSAAQHPFLMENSPSSQSIYGSWKGHVEQGDSMVCPCAAQPQRWQDLNEVIRMIRSAPKILCEHLKLFVLCVYISGMLESLLPPCSPHCGLCFVLNPRCCFVLLHISAAVTFRGGTYGSWLIMCFVLTHHSFHFAE